ncbi:MAG: hypothetical protein KJ955_04120 [Nanoarchaeota archaeon]|nr:hypothetical protein [Nanoarchaeota archaeon]
MKYNKTTKIAILLLAIIIISNLAIATRTDGGPGGITAIGARLTYGNVDLSDAVTTSGSASTSVPAFKLTTPGKTIILTTTAGATINTDQLIFASRAGFRGLYYNDTEKHAYSGDSFTLNSVEYTISRRGTGTASAYRISTTRGETIIIGTRASNTLILPDSGTNVKIVLASGETAVTLPATGLTVVFNNRGADSVADAMAEAESGAAERGSVTGTASEQAVQGCSDNDESEDDDGIYVPSHVSVVSDDGAETTTPDYCARSGDVTRLYEAVCTREDTATVRMVVCPEDKVCRAGACTEPDAAIAGKYCLDSDIMTADTAESLGRTAATKGTTVGFYTSTYAANQEGREFGAWSDYCRDEKTLIEYYCSEESRQGMFREIICLNDCEGGKCEDPPYCYDSDGGAYASVQGTIRGVNETGEYFAKTDSCKDTSAVIEYACVASSISGSAAGQECQIGTTIGTTCASGYCKTMYGQQGEITSMVCADCQGDADCSPGKVCWQGACVEADENYVANGFVSYEIACGDGKYCSEGRCVSGVAPTPVCLQCDPLNKFNIRQGTDCNDDGTPSEWTLKRCPAGQICSADRCVPEPKSTIAEVTTAFNNRKKWALLLNETLGWIETAEQIPPLIEAASGSYTDTLEQIAAGLNSLQALMLRGQIGVDPGIEADIGLELFP